MSNTHGKPFDAIVFDLGGVLIELAGVPRMLELLSHRVSVEELWQSWLLSKAVREFEIGRIDAEQFASTVLAEFQLPISAEQFLREFEAWPKGPYPGAAELLDTLGRSYIVACLTNTNVLHWPRISGEMGLLQHFHHAFASHEIGLIKPDADVFAHVVERLGIPAERTLFLDDNQVNVDGARAAGLRAYRVAGLDGTVALLTELEVLK